MRAVIDTNVLLSALLWGGTPHALLEQVRNGTVTLISSPALLAELARVIDRPKFDVILLRTNTSRAQTLAEVRLLAEVIDPPPLAQPVCRDKDDDAVLALTIAAQADIVISGDDDLLCLASFEGIPILMPAQALQKVLESL
ncbi:putative toxin-antitoxin system toxin component, PIN family [Rhodoferax sp.]|uniref:putative toxin-antitoxin system toxin component, PIN family n=1 Tax=Rhodoferax sp. TaxID=50421 RepID=UPI0027579B67|nr:putative toxin-antitoxin system toxin component, PIN family [Rhodoferax sp.]